MIAAKKTFGLIVPTLNPGSGWNSWLAGLRKQAVQPQFVLVVDSSSDPGQMTIPEQCGFELISIPRQAFNHGATRQYAFESIPAPVDILVYMTQDAVLTDEMGLAHLLSAFENPAIAAAYGRQLPCSTADAFAAHARLFNYGPESHTKCLNDRRRMGIKTCFLSNSFAAYRCSDLKAVGGFPVTDFGEDMLVAARLLLNQRSLAYVAEACVEHSHDYSIIEEFSRYQTIGRFHARNRWLLQNFGAPTDEGLRFIRSEFHYLLQSRPHLAPLSGIRTLAKYIGYRLGRLAG